jgi:hypothetical protein
MRRPLGPLFAISLAVLPLTVGACNPGPDASYAEPAVAEDRLEHAAERVDAVGRRLATDDPLVLAPYEEAEEALADARREDDPLRREALLSEVELHLTDALEAAGASAPITPPGPEPLTPADLPVEDVEPVEVDDPPYPRPDLRDRGSGR